LAFDLFDNDTNTKGKTHITNIINPIINEFASISKKYLIVITYDNILSIHHELNITQPIKQNQQNSSDSKSRDYKIQF